MRKQFDEGTSQAMECFAGYLKACGLKMTNQRSNILKIFCSCNEHLSPEELYGKLQQTRCRTGQATVYRTLKLLSEAGLAREVRFDDGPARYERRFGKGHHDHLLCESCGCNIEVMDPRIEALQEQLAEREGFTLTGHQMYLYGICKTCREKF